MTKKCSSCFKPIFSEDDCAKIIYNDTRKGNTHTRYIYLCKHCRNQFNDILKGFLWRQSGVLG